MHHRNRIGRIARVVLVGLGLAFWTESALAQEAKELALGSSIPLADITLQGVDGSSTTLGNVGGEAGTVVVFWSNTCPWVAKFEDRMIALAGEYQQKGFGFVLVNSNDPEAFPDEALASSQQRAKDKGYTFPYAMDDASRLAMAFGATRTPHIYVFDKGKQLVYVGTIDDNPSDASKVNERYLKDALDATLAGQAVKVPKTKAFGCTIKFAQAAVGG